MVSGGIDLSIGQMMCFIGTGMAFMMRIVGLNDWLVASLGVVVAVLFQVLMGFIISRTKLEPFIVSLGFMTIYKGFTYLITNGSEITIVDHFTFLGRDLYQHHARLSGSACRSSSWSSWRSSCGWY